MFFLKTYFVLECSWLATLWEFQVDSKGTPATCKHVPNFSRTPLPSSLPCNSKQSLLCYTEGPCWLSWNKTLLNLAIPGVMSFSSLAGRNRYYSQPWMGSWGVFFVLTWAVLYLALDGSDTLVNQCSAAPWGSHLRASGVPVELCPLWLSDLGSQLPRLPHLLSLLVPSVPCGCWTLTQWAGPRTASVSLRDQCPYCWHPVSWELLFHIFCQFWLFQKEVNPVPVIPVWQKQIVRLNLKWILIFQFNAFNFPKHGLKLSDGIISK